MADDGLQMLPPGARKALTPIPPTPAAPASPLQMLPPGQRPAPAADPATAPAAPADPLLMPRPGQREGATPTDTGPGWGIDWSKPGGQVTMPQSAQDWSTIAARNSLMGLYGSPSKADTDAARARLGPDAAASADVAGGERSAPHTSLLNGVPQPAGARCSSRAACMKGS